MDSTISPYSNAYGLQFDNGDVTLERVPFRYSASDDDVTHTVKEGETIQGIANDYYKDSGLWYVIADANSIFNPLTDVTPNLKLIIPHGRQ